jgi:PhnB protein
MDQRIIPMLAYENGVEAMNWLCKVFGFNEKTKWLDDNGRLSHGEITIGENMIMLAEPTPDYQSPKHHRKKCKAASKWYEVSYIINGVLVYVDDVENHFKTAKAGGANILSEIEMGGPGTRYRVEDLEGQRWMFMQKS